MRLREVMHIITKEAIETTVSTLAALDAVQATFYRNEIFPLIKTPHSESDSFSLSSESLKQFVKNAPLGNDCGVRMNTSSFVCGLQLVGLDDEARHAMEFCATLNTDE